MVWVWNVTRFGMLHPGRVAGLLVTNTEHSDSAGLQELMVSSWLQWLVMQGVAGQGQGGSQPPAQCQVSSGIRWTEIQMFDFIVEMSPSFWMCTGRGQRF